MPTGGISEKNINEYLAFNKILACGGSWMVKDALIKEGKFDEITAMTKAAVQKVLGFELAHIGINTESEADALAVANLFSAAFGFAVKNGNSSVFAGTGVEANKNGGKGKNGHIAIKTNNIDRAMAYLERIGFEIDAESVKPGVAAYLKQEFGGFAVHLLQAK